MHAMRWHGTKIASKKKTQKTTLCGTLFSLLRMNALATAVAGLNLQKREILHGAFDGVVVDALESTVYILLLLATSYLMQQ